MGILKSLLDIAQLRERLSNNVKVQEGDEPAEDPEDLFRDLRELDSKLQQANWMTDLK